MFFRISLYLAIAACLAGLAYKIWSWLTVSIEKEDERFSPGERLRASLTEMGRIVFSRRLGTMLKAIVLDGLLQKRSLAHSHLAWLAHFSMFTGFMGLLLLHALGDVITANLFSGYYSTLDPWLFLRDFMGLMVLVGVGLVIYRRATLPGLRLITGGMDRLAIVFLAVILLSGFALQAVKITSSAAYERMVTEYAGLGSDEEKLALRSVWAAEYGVIFAPGQTSQDPQVLALGKQLNQDNCLDCHSPAQNAFASYGLSLLVRPVALALDKMGAADILYYIHFLTCFLGLALLPFTKFLHLFSGPILLATNAVVDRKTMNPAARAALRALEMDACAHCGTCTVHCSVSVTLHRINNKHILPSEKLASLAGMVHGECCTAQQLAEIREGAYICTDCYRCTRLCPLGINLNDLWAALKKNLALAGYGHPLREVAQQAQKAAEPSREQSAVKVVTGGFQHGLSLAAQASTFNACYTCRQCTNACPLVFMSEQPKDELDLLPHEIMYSLKLGLKEEAMGARMVWKCLTCYQCQEACPNSVKVTDILYELRYLAAKAASGPEA